MKSEIQLDLTVDLNSMDETGLPWAFFDDAVRPERVKAGAYVVVGSGEVRAVAQIVDVADGIVHVRPLSGSVVSNSHLITASRPAS